MGDKTGISWTDATWNPVAGCSVISPGCTNCYAMMMAARLDRMGVELYRGLTQSSKAGPVWTGEIRLSGEKQLTQPMRWKKPRRIFVNSMSDLFHRGLADDDIGRPFTVMAMTPQHVYQILTKRSDRMKRLMNGPKSHEHWHPKTWHRSILPNVWLGVSVENRAALHRIDDLRATPAAKRFLSIEPLLEDLGEIELAGIDWVIVGGESGPDARPMHPDWARSIRDQCAAAGTPYFFKQWGDWMPVVDRETDDPDWQIVYSNPSLHFGNGRYRFHNLAGGQGFHGERVHLMKKVGKKAAGSLLDGIAHKEFPT